jgi:hypothetical protein
VASEHSDSRAEEGEELSLLAPQTWFLPTQPPGKPQEAVVTVSAPAGLAWTASASESWIVLGTGASGQGPGHFTFTVQDNTGGMRQGTVSVGGQVLPILQLSSPTWQEQQVRAAPLPYIEQVGLEGFIKQINKLPPPARPAGLAALVLAITGAGAAAEVLYKGFPTVPEHFTPEFIEQVVREAVEYVAKHATDT